MTEQLYGLTESDRAFLRSLRQQFDGGALAPQSRRTQFPTPDRNYGRVWFYNNSGETAPAHGVMKVSASSSVNNRPVITIVKPNSTQRAPYLVNGDKDVASGKYGWGTWLWHADYVLYDNASTPAYGEFWSPQSGQWTIKKGGSAFLVYGLNLTSPVRTHAIQQWNQPIAGGYRTLTNGTLTSTDLVLNWGDFHDYSHPLIVEDGASPKTKLYLSSGVYLSWLSFYCEFPSVSAGTTNTVRTEFEGDGTGYFGDSVNITPLKNWSAISATVAGQCVNLSMIRVQPDATYIKPKVTVASASSPSVSSGSWYVQRVYDA